MKQIKIKCGNKQVVITKNLLTIVVGIIILIGDALLAGFVQLFEFGFNWDRIFTSAFWILYSIKLTISYVALFGAYLIRRTINKQNPKFVAQRQKVKDCKNEIVKAKKIGNCKNWLKYCYNYTKKVEKYQEIISNKYEKLVFKEPEQPDIDHLDKTKMIDRWKIKIINNRYRIAKNKYEKSETLRKFYEEQLKVCEIHFEIIDCYKKHDIAKVKSLQEEIKNKDCMKYYKLHYKNITYNKLFNVNLGANKQDDGIEYNEAGIMLKKILPTMLMGVVLCVMLTSVIIQAGDFTATTLLMIAANLLTMSWFMFSGIRYADSFVLETVLSADNNRVLICEEFLEDSALNGDGWTQNIDTSYEPEIEENKDVENKKEEVIPTDQCQITKV